MVRCSGKCLQHRQAGDYDCPEAVLRRTLRPEKLMITICEAKERLDMILWWIGDLILLFVVLPVVYGA